MDEKRNKSNHHLDWGFGILMFTVIAIGLAATYVSILDWAVSLAANFQ